MKKIAKLLALVMMSLALASCSSGTNSSDSSTNEGDKGEKISITVQADPTWVEHYEAAADRVEAKFPNADIIIKAGGSFENLDLIDSTDVTNPDVADVYALPADRIYGLAKNEALAEIDGPSIAAEIGGFKDYDGGLGGNFKIDGKYLAFPMNIETLILFANKQNAESKNVDLTAVNEFTTLEHEVMLASVHDTWHGVAFTNSGDITLLGKNDDGTFYSDMTKNYDELNEKQQGVINALYSLWKTHDENGTDLWDTAASWGYMDSSFGVGTNTVLRLDGPWATASMTEKIGVENVEVLPINRVTVNGNPLAHWKGGWGLGINPRIEENEGAMEVAIEMIKEVVNPEHAVSLFKTSGKILENVTLEEYQNSDLSELDKKVIASVMESYDIAPPRPLFTEWGEVWGTWQSAILSWASVKPQSPQEAYEQVQASFTALLSSF